MCSTKFFSHIEYHIRKKILLPKICHNPGMGQEFPSKSGCADRSIPRLKHNQNLFLVLLPLLCLIFRLSMAASEKLQALL